jgi:hypothetical protein
VQLSLDVLAEQLGEKSFTGANVGHLHARPD